MQLNKLSKITIFISIYALFAKTAWADIEPSPLGLELGSGIETAIIFGFLGLLGWVFFFKETPSKGTE